MFRISFTKRVGFFAGPAWLGCLATPTIQVKFIDAMRLTSNSLPRLITLIQDAACVKSKLIVFLLEKDKIPVVTVVIMYDLLSGKCSTMKVHMFSMTSTLWPSFFVHICSFFPFSSVPNQKVRQAWAFNLLLYEDLGIEVRWGPWMKVKWGNPPSYLATQVISFCPNKIGKQIHDHLKDSQSPMESPSAKWFLLVCRSEGADLFPSHHGNLAKSRLAKKTLF